MESRHLTRTTRARLVTAMYTRMALLATGNRLGHRWRQRVTPILKASGFAAFQYRIQHGIWVMIGVMEIDVAWIKGGKTVHRGG